MPACEFTQKRVGLNKRRRMEMMMKYVSSLILVNDISVSRYFYEHILKQKVKYDFGENIIFIGDFAIHHKKYFQKLLENKVDPILSRSNNFELYFECEDIDETYDELMKQKIEFIHEIKQQPWQQKVIRFYDPDFNIIELGETMEAVVLRLHKNKISEEEISKQTSWPIDIVRNIIRSQE
jgi:extradiol dioxygenase family protein